MKKYFFTGLALFLPICIPILIGIFLFRIMTDPFLGIIEWILVSLHISESFHDLFLITFKCLFLIGMVLFICLLGIIGHQFFSKWFLAQVEKIFLKIPIIKTIYRISDEITKSFLQSTEKPFKKSVMLRFPNHDSYIYGLLTGETPSQILEKSGSQDLKTVFVPTAPHPISGFLFMVKGNMIEEVDISVENIFKTLISCGIYNADDATHAKKPPSND